MLPVVYQVFDAALLLGCSCEEIIFVVQKELEFFFSHTQCAFSSVEPLAFYKSAVLILLIKEAVAKSNAAITYSGRYPFTQS